jgi:DNA invertase Pin-like site-specific DNA recombinase
MSKPLRLDLVIRTSKRKQDAQSPAQQRQVAAAAAGDRYEIVATHDSGKSESGKTMGRTSIVAARKRMRAGETDGILVAYLDRLGRAPIEESMAFVRELTRDGGVLVAADWGPDPIELSDPNAETMLVFRLQMNRDQWTKARGRFALSQRNALAAGKFVGPTPLGYAREAGRLHEHPVNGPIVSAAYKLAARDGLHAALDYLAVEVPQRKWTTDSVRKLLASRVYLGEAWIWVPKEDRDPDGEKVRASKSDAHDPLTDLATWTAAQTAPRRRRPNGTYPLTGIARCSACEGSLSGQLQSFDSGKSYRRYRCSTCCKVSITADGLEEFTRGRIGLALADRATFVRVDEGGLTEAAEELEKANSELTAYLTNPALSALGDAFTAGADARAARLKEAERRYQEAASRSARSEWLFSSDELSDDEQFQRALAVMISAVNVRPGRGPVSERAEITWVDEIADVPNSPFYENASEKTILKGMKALAAGQRQKDNQGSSK